MQETKDIIVTVIGGVVQEVDNIPAGVRVLVRDYDTDGTLEDEIDGRDENGDPYVEAVWEAEETTDPEDEVKVLNLNQTGSGKNLWFDRMKERVLQEGGMVVEQDQNNMTIRGLRGYEDFGKYTAEDKEKEDVINAVLKCIASSSGKGKNRISAERQLDGTWAGDYVKWTSVSNKIMEWKARWDDKKNCWLVSCSRKNPGGC